MKNKRIEQWQYDYIVEHLNDRPRKNVAKAAGVGLSVVYRIVRENGGEIKSNLSKANYECRDVTIANFPMMSAREIADKFGFEKSCVIRWAKKLGLKHTDETNQRLYLKVKESLKKSRTLECQAKIASSIRRTHRLEKFRVLSGLPQKTKLTVAVMPRRISKAIWHLCRNYDYFTVPEVTRWRN